LVLRTRSEFDDFAGKNGERLEVSGFSFYVFFLTPDT
jgi:hypothetical protein